jgi:outer membrane translocation and assembly module TamA
MSVNAVASDLPAEWIGPDAYAYYSAGMSLLLDYRDSAVLPKKGWFLSLRGDYNLDAIDEGASFLRQEARAAWLVPLSDKWRLAMGGTAESLLGAGFSEIPIDSRVFNGGPNSVRAFAMRELGPVTEGGTPLGGTAALFASVELSREILPNLELAVFYDTGSLDLRESNRPFHFSSDLRHGVGAGLRYLLPFGPLRLDYGYNLDRREGEAQGRVHVTAGFAF